jgi:hypothetical protein
MIRASVEQRRTIIRSLTTAAATLTDKPLTG